MIKSMTGFGEAACEAEGISCVVEIRTVNNRYFKATVKLPEPLVFLNDEIEKLMRKTISRGSVSYALKAKAVTDDLFFDVDQTAVQRYLKKLRQLAAWAEVPFEIKITDLLSLPGVVQPAEPEEQKAERIRQMVFGVTQQAIDNLLKMRTEEGLAVERDLDVNCRSIEQTLGKIRERRPIVLKEYHEKLKNRVQELLGSTDIKITEELLAREVAIFADRCDIAEEIARLDSHIHQFLESCKRDEPVGRRLDFLSQEMLREANTISSKASDAEIITAVVEIKCMIERIKEQVQNVE